MIEAVVLSKVYDKNAPPAVDALTLTVSPGELFGFLGPNGAGKTTTIKMLVGLLTPSAGRAAIGGFEARTPQAKRLTGYVPDNPFLYDKLSGREFLDFVADLYSLPSDAARRARADELLETLELAAVAHKLVGGYSRGMRQKLALAAALLPEPSALFLDEPTVGLDPGSIRRLKDILRAQCRERQTAVFLSTHTLEVAAEICDTVGIFQSGRLIALGSPDALRAQSPSGRLEDVFLALTAPESPSLETLPA